jgi:hypothetical protein
MWNDCLLPNEGVLPKISDCSSGTHLCKTTRMPGKTWWVASPARPAATCPSRLSSAIGIARSSFPIHDVSTFARNTQLPSGRRRLQCQGQSWSAPQRIHNDVASIAKRNQVVLRIVARLAPQDPKLDFLKIAFSARSYHPSIACLGPTFSRQ